MITQDKITYYYYYQYSCEFTVLVVEYKYK